MALEKPYVNIPGTTVFDAALARRGYHLNQFCMSLMKAENRQSFKADEAAYLNRWPMSEAQKQAVIRRDFSRLIELGGNIYFLVKISSTDGWSVSRAVSTMTEYSPQEYEAMMKAGGRSPQGNLYCDESDVSTAQVED